MTKESSAQRKWLLEMSYEEVELLRTLRGLRYGRVTVVVQDRRLVRLEKVEQRAFSG